MGRLGPRSIWSDLSGQRCEGPAVLEPDLVSDLPGAAESGCMDPSRPSTDPGYGDIGVGQL